MGGWATDKAERPEASKWQPRPGWWGEREASLYKMCFGGGGGWIPRLLESVKECMRSPLSEKAIVGEERILD